MTSRGSRPGLLPAPPRPEPSLLPCSGPVSPLSNEETHFTCHFHCHLQKWIRTIPHFPEAPCPDVMGCVLTLPSSLSGPAPRSLGYFFHHPLPLPLLHDLCHQGHSATSLNNFLPLFFRPQLPQHSLLLLEKRLEGSGEAGGGGLARILGCSRASCRYSHRDLSEIHTA